MTAVKKQAHAELAPVKPLEMTCVCGGREWGYSKVDQFMYCVGCKRCSGRNRNGVFSWWPIATCYWCGATAAMAKTQDKKYYCKQCAHWQYDSNGTLAGVNPDVKAEFCVDWGDD